MMRSTSYDDEAIEQLRQPHPEQSQIDADSAALLRSTAFQIAKDGGLDDPEEAMAAAEVLLDRERDAAYFIRGEVENVLNDFDDVADDQETREGWASDDCDYPD